MNNIEFNLPGGFPLETDTLDSMKSAYQSLQAFGSRIGNYAIVQGCEVNGSTTANGYVYLNGELIEFRGGLTQSRVVVNEVPIRKQFENGSEPQVYFERWISFGTGTQAIEWSFFKRPKTSIELSEAQALKAENEALIAVSERLGLIETLLLPFQAGGVMVFWNKPANQIPEGWREVIAWRGRMPVGFDPTQSEFNSIGKIAGDKTRTLTTRELPAHSHGYAGDDQINRAPEANQLIRNWDYDAKSSIGSNTGGIYKTTPVGSGQSFSILNPYRVVLFIEPTRTL